jgi:lipoyl(octanoyl) transferase
MEHFELIVPCGIPDKPVTSLAQVLPSPPSMEDVRRRVAEAFEAVFGVELVSAKPEDVLENSGRQALF